MTYQLRLDLIRLLNHLSELNQATASCYCGRHYRLNFDVPLQALIEKIKAAVDIEPETTRFGLCEVT